MSIRKTIWNLKPEFRNYGVDGVIKCGICYENKTFYGYSYLNKEDIEFQSETIGKTLAHHRAVINCLKYQKERAHQDYDAIFRIYNEVRRMYPNKDISFLEDRLGAAAARCKRYDNYVKDETAKLNRYVTATNKTFETLTKIRIKNQGKTE